MAEWWTALSLEQQIYWSLGGAATALLLVQTLLLLVGGADLVDAGDVDMEDPSEHPSGIHVLSTRTLVSFFVGFGWTGAVVARHGFGGPETAAITATLTGTLFAWVVYRLMRLFHDLQDSGTLDYHSAIGEVGSVYLPIPPGLDGPGRIEVMIQGRLKVIQALTRHAERLENRSRVRVVDLLDENTLLVEPLREEE